MRAISSSHNPLFKQLKKLSGAAKERRKAGLTLLEGYTLLEAYLDTGLKPRALICCANSPDKGRLISLGAAHGITIFEFSATLYAEISNLEHADGYLTLIEVPKNKQKNFGEFCVFLEGIQDPGNVGTIIRTAAAAGADQVYLYQCADAWSPKALRGSMGAHFSLAIFENVNIVKLLSTFPGATYATTAAATNSLFNCDLTGQIAFVFGNEGAGVSPTAQSLAHYQISIPMPGKVESLNAAAAAAVCCFERVRQIKMCSAKTKK